MPETRKPTVQEKLSGFGRTTLAHSPRTAQAWVDRHIITHKLRDGRNLILATNKTTAIPEENKDDPSKQRPSLDYVREEVGNLIEGQVVTIIAYSGRNHPHEGPYSPETGRDYERSADMAIEALEQFHPSDYILLHRATDKPATIAKAKTVFVAGGNSSEHSSNLFGLVNLNGQPLSNVKGANSKPLQYALRMRIAEGIPYVGASAGQMIATGNVVPHLDAPTAVHVERKWNGETRISIPYEGLNLLGNFGLAVHPHYNPDRFTNYGDTETQKIRVMQILERNPWMTILGMQDNSALEVKGNSMKLIGDPTATAFILSFNRETSLVESQQIGYGHDLSHYLDTDQRLDVATRLRR